MRKELILLVISLLISTAIARTPIASRITVFIKPCLSPVTPSISESDETITENSTDIIAPLTKVPGKINRKLMRHVLAPPYRINIIASYGGYMTYADSNGQISFPRAHAGEEITYVLSTRIRPIMSVGNTVSSFIIPESTAAAFYKLTRVPTKDRYGYWHVEAVDIPKDRVIPPFALHFFVKPAELLVDEGDFTTVMGQHFLLPPLCIPGPTSDATNTMSYLKVSKFFAPVKFVYNYTIERYATIIKN